MKKDRRTERRDEAVGTGRRLAAGTQIPSRTSRTYGYEHGLAPTWAIDAIAVANEKRER